MTEYWVSQGNKWCDFCKIYIANNPLSIRTHELGQRHKDNVSKRLQAVKKESAAKEKEKKEAERALEQIEDKAKHSYQKDLAEFRESKEANEGTSGLKEIPIKYIGESKDWEYDAASGYYYNLANGYYYDSKSGLYYCNAKGKWITREEAFLSSKASPCSISNAKSKMSEVSTVGGSPSGLTVSRPPNTMRTSKGIPSSIAPNKRKREDEKTKVISKEEADAIKAREAARKRVEEREKNLLGLYKSY